MVAFLKKPEGSEGFHQIVYFLNSTHIQYALSKNPTIYVLLIHQFWQTASASTSENGGMEITATIDERVKIVTEASIRRHLKLEDSDEQLDEEERKRIAKVHEEANTFNAEEWDNIQAQIEADKELAQKLQAEERGKFSEVKKARLLVEMINERKRLVNTFTPMESDDTVPKVVPGSSKRDAEQELNPESLKRQKIGEGSEPAEESKDELSQEQLQQLMISRRRDEYCYSLLIVKEFRPEIQVELPSGMVLVNSCGIQFLDGG
ncbi:hypothetical protein Tco_1058288 [Tanacetum coccineum]|uniref:Uncharacterized protein n=1 Tax=Tanacetum coccineum TaxID=301880 RepID=A0ABQ5H7S5_9ASTR